jgi:hypothetical protein
MNDHERRRLEQARETVRRTKIEAELLKAAIRETRQQIDASLELLRRTPRISEIRPTAEIKLDH